MFLLTKPSADQISRFINSQSDKSFSYPFVGATSGVLPVGYKIDHNRQRLGKGDKVFNLALSALHSWKHFDLGWVQIFPADSGIKVGSVVAVRCRHFGFWSLNACRVVYLVNESGPVRRIGFAYGTLRDHAERGEERFVIEWDGTDDSVWYDILAVSQPAKFVVRLALPLARMLQRRFARDSKRRMLETCGAPLGEG